MKNEVFEQTMDNMKKLRDFMFLTAEARRDYLLSEPQCDRKLINCQQQKKTLVTMNKPPYLGLLILEIIKIVICEIFFDYVKPNMNKKQIYAIGPQIDL